MHSVKKQKMLKKILKKEKLYREANKEKIAKKGKIYRETNKEKEKIAKRAQNQRTL